MIETARGIRLPNHKKVIQLVYRKSEVDPPWRFFDCLENNRNVIELDWYQGLSEEAQDIFDSLLKQNQKVSLPVHWSGMKFLKGDCQKEGIWEWRFFADDRQQRVLGIFAEQRKEAVFLIGCYHKQNVYTPAGCLETAIRRAKAVRKWRTVSERKVKTDI